MNWIDQFDIRGLEHARRDPAITGAPSFSVNGFNGWGDDGGLPLIRRNNTYQLIENFSFNKGRHFMKIGGEIRKVFENVVRAQVTRGDFSFSNAQWTGVDGVGNTGHTLANFLLGLSRQKIAADLRFRHAPPGDRVRPLFPGRFQGYTHFNDQSGNALHVLRQPI